MLGKEPRSSAECCLVTLIVAACTPQRGRHKAHHYEPGTPGWSSILGPGFQPPAQVTSLEKKKDHPSTQKCTQKHTPETVISYNFHVYNTLYNTSMCN